MLNQVFYYYSKKRKEKREKADDTVSFLQNYKRRRVLTGALIRPYFLAICMASFSSTQAR